MRVFENPEMHRRTCGPFDASLGFVDSLSNRRLLPISIPGRKMSVSGPIGPETPFYKELMHRMKAKSRFRFHSRSACVRHSVMPRKPFPMISLEEVMVMKLWGSVARMNSCSRTAWERFTTVMMIRCFSWVKEPSPSVTVAL